MVLIPAVVSLSALGGLLLFLRRKPPMTSKTKTQLNVQLDKSDYNKLQVWAQKNDLTLSDYVRNTLIASIPAQEQKRMNGNEEGSSVMDEAFKVLDKQDETDTGGCMPLPPARQPQKGVVTEANRTHPLQRVTSVTPMPLPSVPPGPHSCGHLSSSIPANQRGQCQGTCVHMQQRGRPCYWTPTTARSCPLFEDKRHEARARLVRSQQP